MAGREVFVDTSALYPVMAERVRRLLDSGHRLVTTDYVVCEAMNLASARAGYHVGTRILELIERSVAPRAEWIGSLRFDTSTIFYRRHSDHRYSFTDCTSFVVMQKLRIAGALTTDEHFTEAGFQVLS